MYDEQTRPLNVCMSIVGSVDWAIGIHETSGLITAAREGEELARLDFVRMRVGGSAARRSNGDEAQRDLTWFDAAGAGQHGTMCMPQQADLPPFVLCEVCLPGPGCLATELIRPGASGGGW